MYCIVITADYMTLTNKKKTKTVRTGMVMQ